MPTLPLKISRIVFILSLLFLTVGCDQVTKLVARDTLKDFKTYSYFSGKVVFQHAENPGAFLSFGSTLPDSWRFGIFTVAVAFFLMATLFILFQKSNMDRGTTVCLSFLVGGGIGNLIDRSYKGSVTDFIHLDWGLLRTGIFNVADVAIIVGMLCYVLIQIRRKKLGIPTTT